MKLIGGYGGGGEMVWTNKEGDFVEAEWNWSAVVYPMVVLPGSND